MATSPRPTIAQLRAQIAELEAENAALTARLSQPSPTAPALPRQRWRGALAIVLIVIGSLLIPVAAVAGWSRILLTDTEAFVATYGPLANDPRVQSYITDQVATAIDQRLDIDSLVGKVITGVSANIDQPSVKDALQLLQQPAADGVRASIRSATESVVSSDAFAQAWRESLRLTHAQALAALTADPNSALTITDEGLGLRLAPLIDQVKQTLIKQGFSLAEHIPAIEKTITIAPAEDLAKAQVIYRIAVVAGTWLGLVAVAFLVAGVLVSRHRFSATIGAAIGLALGALMVLGAIALGRVSAELSVPATVMPDDVLTLLYDTATTTVSDLATAALLLAVVVAITAWLAGPFAAATRLRGGYATLVDGLRRAADDRGVSTGKTGTWLYVHRRGLRVGVGIVAAVILLLNHPLGAATVIGVTIAAVVVLFALSLAERPTLAPATGQD